MFIILLKFSDNKSKAPEFMQGHKDWIKRGFDESLFLISGSIKPNMGGCIIAHNTSQEKLQQYVNEDPFVARNIVTAQVLVISANQVDKRLNFLLDKSIK
ncbi:hypothetical protein MNBD_GAMMA05-1073 [hydrothermal vent metagenome]|uniref:YCII-related domain-containing protein n=1 Tax=hydrothermal vent metagenome TaxID=652676 RepID=A0A3B0WIY1_9ZZZZ